MNQQLKYRTIQCFKCERKGCTNQSAYRFTYEHGDIHICEQCFADIWKKARKHRNVRKASRCIQKSLEMVHLP